MASPVAFEPPLTLAEWFKFMLIPAPLYTRYLVNKNLKRGEAELRLLPDLVPRDRVAVDVGANKGVYTHVLASLASHVHAFEPNPKAYRWLERALPDNVTPHRVALSDRDGDGVLYVPKRGRGYSNQHGSLNEMTATRPHGAVSVTSRSMDSCALTNVGFIKIDVEGFEREVLAGATRTIHQSRPTLLVEIEERHTGRPLEQSIGEITALGYDAYFVDDNSLMSVDNLDIDSQHRAPATPSEYVFNFVFKPVL